ncbi:MAG: hypothetical protein KDE53_24270 [Caldilineaceae bacterium]|nr:hypothetical protein [Caldilineaceae bacterium]
MSDNFSMTELPIYQENIDVPITYTYDKAIWDHAYPTTASMTQTGFVRLRVVLSTISSLDGKPQHNGIWVRFFDEDTIGGSMVSAGTPIANDDEKGRGWFLESAQVGVNVTGDGVMFQGSQPNTKDQTGSVSSSSGFNVSGGLFGDAPMATAGFSTNRSVSYDYKSVTFTNDSSRQLLHRYQMSGTTGSHASSYNHYSDMVWGGTDAFGHHAQVRTPAAECFNPGNLPIISQGFWTVPQSFQGLVPVNINLSLKWVIVLLHDKDGIGDYSYHYWWQETPIIRQLKVKWPDGTLEPVTDQAVATWLHNVQNSGASVVAMAHKLAGAPLLQYTYYGDSQTPTWGAQVDPSAAPWDYSDFGHCYNFLQKFPQYKADLNQLTALSPAWNGLVTNWTAISNAYASQQKAKVNQLIQAAHKSA